MNRFTDCLTALDKLARELGSPIAVVGGLTAIHHQAQVTTLDVDIAVARAQLEDIVVKAQRLGFEIQAHSAAGWHRLVYPHAEGKVEVHVIPEGVNSPRDPPHAPPNPGPRDLGVTEGLGYAAFAPWTVMKLVAARDKDRYHIVETLKHASQVQVAEVVKRLRSLDPSYTKEFERLLRAAEDERAQVNW